jgi:oligopeptide/dipeptide ABC transporter ATP-binding protein
LNASTLPSSLQPTPIAEQPLIRVENLVKKFPIRKGFFNRTVGHIHALSGIDLTIQPGETLGIVGESGCGKSTLGRSILQLISPTSGQVFFQETELTTLSQKQLRPLRRNMQMIFQNPYSSLDPRMSIGDTLAEPFQIHRLLKGPLRQARLKELLDLVGLPKDALSRYPHEFSGGQRQRVAIARALTLNPQFIVADEPVSALDVSIQAQILNLMQDLKQTLNLTYLFIAHNLSVVEYISDRVAVMYLGQVVEIAPSKNIYEQPLHPYTQALLRAVPVPDPRQRKSRASMLLGGEPPNPVNPPSGCRFHTRCSFVIDKCKQEAPPLLQMGEAHQVLCHRAPEIAAGQLH